MHQITVFRDKAFNSTPLSAYGASILAPTALDTRLTFENAGFATAWHSKGIGPWNWVMGVRCGTF